MAVEIHRIRLGSAAADYDTEDVSAAFAPHLARWAELRRNPTVDADLRAGRRALNEHPTDPTTAQTLPSCAMYGDCPPDVPGGVPRLVDYSLSLL